MKRLLLRFFTQDIGRKLLALLFAIVLFDVLDRKVQVESTLTANVVYVDEADLDRVPESLEVTAELLVAERVRGGKPLVVAGPRSRPKSVTFNLHATRDAIDRAKRRRYTFVYRLAKEGVLEPAPGDIEGVDQLVDELGPGARVEIEPIWWEVETEERSPVLKLVRDDFVLRGSPAPGYDRRHSTLTFRPTEVVLVGPRSAVTDALRRRSELFEALRIENQPTELTQDVLLARDWQDVLRMEDVTGEELPTVRVSVKFERRMRQVQAQDGSFKRPVHVVCDDEVLRRNDPQRSWNDGWRLHFTRTSGEQLQLALVLLAPESFIDAPALDRAKLTLAKDNVELVVRAQEAAGVPERTMLAVRILKLPDFPPDLDVAFADGSPRADVEVAWVRPPLPGDDPSKKGGGNGGN